MLIVTKRHWRKPLRWRHDNPTATKRSYDDMTDEELLKIIKVRPKDKE